MRREKMLKGVLSFALLVFVMGIMIWLNPANARAGSLYDVYWKVDKDEAGKYRIQLSHDTGMKEGITEGWDCYTREEQKKDIENDQCHFCKWISYVNDNNIGWSNIKSVRVIDEISPINMKGFFYGLLSVTSIDGFENIDTSQALDMSEMFHFCTGFENLDLKSFDTSKVKKMNNMFFMCMTIKSIDVSSFQTSQVEDMSSMFCYCYALKDLDVSKFVTSKVKNFSFMFEACGALEKLNVSGFDTGNAVNFYGMFSGCKSVSTIDVSKFDTSNANDMGAMFDACSALEEVNVSEFKTSNVTNMSRMFSGCALLKSLDVSGFDTGNTEDTSGMFKGCTSLTSLDLRSFDISKVTDFSRMFYGCGKLENITTACNADWSGLQGDGSSAFGGCEKLTGQKGTTYDIDNTDLQYARIDQGADKPGYFTAGDHTWDDGTVTTEATVEKEGVKTYRCTVCGETKTESIDKLPAPTNPETKGKDGTAFGKGASLSLAEKKILSQKSSKDPAGTKLRPLCAKSPKQSSSAVAVTWKKVSGARKYIVYGNAEGKAMKKLKQVTATKATISKIGGKKLAKKTYYKFMVIAVDGKDKVVSSSKIVHVATKGGKVGNYKAIKTAARKNKVALKKGKRFKLRAKALPVSKKLKVKSYRKIQYESSAPAIASVSKKGVVKGRKKGQCKIYIYLQNGITKTIKVIVK